VQTRCFGFSSAEVSRTCLEIEEGAFTIPFILSNTREQQAGSQALFHRTFWRQPVRVLGDIPQRAFAEQGLQTQVYSCCEQNSTFAALGAKILGPSFRVKTTLHLGTCWKRSKRASDLNQLKLLRKLFLPPDALQSQGEPTQSLLVIPAQQETSSVRAIVKVRRRRVLLLLRTRVFCSIRSQLVLNRGQTSTQTSTATNESTKCGKEGRSGARQSSRSRRRKTRFRLISAGNRSSAERKKINRIRPKNNFHFIHFNQSNKKQ